MPVKPADDAQLAALWAYTLGRGDAEFVHQHAVDAAGAQRADGRTTPMQLTFSLVGLYLGVERGYTGRQVQRAHADLARRRPSDWPTLTPPVERGATTIASVLSAPEGAPRDAAIHAWCADVWSAYAIHRDAVIGFLRRHGIQ